MTRVAAVLLLGVLIPMPSPAAAGGGEARLRVRVLDPSGAVVPGAVVSVAAGPEEREGATDRSGRVVFEALPAAEALVTAALAGFDGAARPVTLRRGENEVELVLSLAARTERLEVAPEDRPVAGQGFGSVLTEAEIAALPDDPEELENALRAIAGPDAVLRVNGFSGGRLPPKSQIRQIRFQMNPYSAEFHEAGHPRVDILTKPGLASWRRSVRGGLRNAVLNARPPLAPEQPADSYGRWSLGLDGPLRRGRTSGALGFEGRTNAGARTIRGVSPAGPFSELAPQDTSRLDLQARIEHAWGGSHTLRAEYQLLGSEREGLAASAFDLPERAYTQDDLEHLVRVSDSGAWGKRAALETILEVRAARATFRPVSGARAVQVLGAFTAGGAQVEGGRRSTSFTLAQSLDWGTRRQSFRAGFRLEAEHRDSDEGRNRGGTFVFPDLEAYELGRPAQLTQQVGDPRVAFAHVQAGFYLQDEIKLGRRATLSLGLRSETQTRGGGAFQLGPRLALAWALDGHTTLRMGAGVFRDWLTSSARAEILRLDGTHSLDLTATHPGYPDPELSTADAVVSSRYWPVSLPGLPRIDRVSVGLERTAGDALRGRLDLSWERRAGTLRTLNCNAPLPAAGRPDPEEGNVLELVAEGRARRRTLHVNGGYLKPGAPASLFAGYVLSQSENDGDLMSVPATPAGLAGEWGPSLDDVRHRVFGFGRARLGMGLAAAALLRVESGSPYDVTTGLDGNGDTILNDRPAGLGRNAARGETRVALDLRLSWSRGFGPAVAPSGPTAHVMRLGDGEMPAEAPGPDANRRFQVMVYAQAFNATNHTNVRAYAGVMTSPLFGQPVSAEPGRRLELGASLTF